MKPIPLIHSLLTLALPAAAGADSLESAFVHPPASARPLTWWHWLDGNITRGGITGDLEAMKRAGLGGVYLFNCGINMPDGPVRFMQPPWLEMFDHTVREARRLDLKLGIHNCDGFSQSGGPWITPETSMKVLTWSALDVAGGGGERELILPPPPRKEDFYQDIAVVAFPIPDGGPLDGARLRGSIQPRGLEMLTDGDADTAAVFPVKEGGHFIEFVFPEPRTVRSVVVRKARPHNWEEDFPIRMEVSADGANFRPVTAFTANWDFTDGDAITAACDATEGRVFRLSFNNPWAFGIGGIELSSAARTHFAEAKAGLLRSRGHGAETRHHRAYPGPDRLRALDASLVIKRGAARVLTDKPDGGGSIKWPPPAGRWRVLRVGFTSNGHHVSPATREGRGLECDKLDPQAVRFHLDQYVGKLLERSGPAAGETLGTMEVDSWECGIQNWTAGFERRFRQSAGYDLLEFLPALLEGWIVENADVTERALWDWRRFVADQLSENYFATVAKWARERGLTYVGESNGRQQYLYDIAYMRNSDVTMGEFWLDTDPGQGVRVDNKLAASVARTTGKRLVAAESFTASPAAARWRNHPFSMKALGDRAFCAGVNQYVFHTFAHQPHPAPGPGFTFGVWGLNFNRANTWWETGTPAWMEYLSRCNHLLQEGRAVSDVLHFAGEDVPNRIAWRDELRPRLPEGHDFDGCDAQAVMDAQARDGRIVLPGGAEYRVLLLPDLTTMRPEVLEKVHDLAASGAVIVGPRPAQSPALRDLGAGDQRVRGLAEKLWGVAADGPVDRAVGGGRVFANLPFEEILQRINLPADFEWRAAGADAEVLYTHRRINGADVYFVSNQRYRAEDVTAIFRVADREPELWDPATGTITRPDEYCTEGGRTRLPLRLDPAGSVFVVFRDAAAPARRAARKPEPPPAPLAVEGPWQVTFPPGLGAPASARLDALVPLNEHADPGIRHFSGTAIYRKKDFTIPPDMPADGRELHLDLGEVAVIAQVKLNGRDLGTLWKPPFRMRIDGAAKPGANDLEVRVTTLWTNRMIGDAALPDDIEWSKPAPNTFPAKWPDWLLRGGVRGSGRVTFCTRRDVFQKDEPLSPAGLIGPVRLLPAARVREVLPGGK